MFSARIHVKNRLLTAVLDRKIVFADEGKARSIYRVTGQFLRQANSQAYVTGDVNPLELYLLPILKKLND